MEKLTILEILVAINNYLMEWGDSPVSLEEAMCYITGRERTDKEIMDIASCIYKTN
jgi:hypothetical protein